jgi:hypothetical protein
VLSLNWKEGEFTQALRVVLRTQLTTCRFVLTHVYVGGAGTTRECHDAGSQESSHLYPQRVLIKAGHALFFDRNDFLSLNRPGAVLTESRSPYAENRCGSTLCFKLVLVWCLDGLRLVHRVDHRLSVVV